MTRLIQDLDVTQFQSLLARNQGCVLLLFWAPWNNRSREMLDETERLANTQAEEISCVAVNVDRGVDLAMSLGMRAVPLLVLLKQGVEVARTSACGPYGGLAPWLWRHGAALGSMPADFKRPDPAQKGAFHGDPALQRQLRDTLMARASQGAILHQRVPFWRNGQGTIGGAIAESIQPDVIEARSGLPFSFVCALEFLNTAWSPLMVEATFNGIPPGADLSMVAIRLVRDVFADPVVDWAKLIDDAQIDQLRTKWLRLLDLHTCSLPVAQHDWDEIVVGLGTLRSQGLVPSRTVQDAFIDLISTLSPPPAHDSELWVNAFSMHGIYLQHAIVAHDLGWGKEDFAYEGQRAQWFMEREAAQPGGRFSHEALAEANAQWMRERGQDQQRYDALFAEVIDQASLFSHRLLQRLLGLLHALQPRQEARPRPSL